MTIEQRSDIVSQTRLGLESYRQRLLDTGTRSAFIDFKHRETSKTQLRIVNASLDSLFQLFDSENSFKINGLRKPADLEPTELNEADEEITSNSERPKRRPRGYDQQIINELALAEGIDPSYDLDPSNAIKQTTSIQTLLFSDQLQKRLQSVQDESKRFIQELGINALSCCLGFLEWREAKQSERVRYAPLLIFPLEMKRQLESNRYAYHISGAGDEIHTNRSMDKRLNDEFGLRLPTFSEEMTIEQYLQEVESVISHQKTWRIRRMATISVLNFSKIVLFEDLDSESRPSNAKLEVHPLIMSLINGLAEGPSSLISNEANVDLPQIASRVSTLVTEADASQFSAIADSMGRESLIIEGPPGTGKSQTITNIIAASMANGERVLFVAEKLAALEVVKTKLDHFGLGDFCLELHSTKARKSDVLSSLKQRLDLQKKPSKHHAIVIESLSQQKERLQAYLTALHTTFGGFSKSIHDLIWREQHLRSLLEDEASQLEDLIILHAAEFDEPGLIKSMNQIRMFEAAHKALVSEYGSPTKQPWHGVKNADLSFNEQQLLVSRLRRYLRIIEIALGFTKAAFQRVDMTSSLTIADIAGLIKLANDLAKLPQDMSSEALERLFDDSNYSAAQRFIENVNAKRTLEKTHLGKNLGEFYELEERLIPISSLFEQVSVEFKSTTLGDIPQKITKYHQNLDLIKRDLETCNALRNWLSRLDFVTLAAVRDLASYLATVPRDILTHRTGIFSAEENWPRIRLLLESGERLKAEDATLRQRFDMHDLPAPAELRKICRLIRNFGTFWFTDSQIRQARRLFKQRDLAHRKMSNDLIASELSTIATLLESINEFSDNDSGKTLLGEEFLGIKTDFGGLRASLAFCERIVELTQQFGNGSLELRAIAMSQPLPEIEKFLEVVQSESFKSICNLNANEPDVVLSEQFKTIEKRVDDLKEFQNILTSTTLRADTQFSDIPILVADAKTHCNLRLKISGDGVAKNVFGVDFDRFCLDSEVPEKWLSYAKIFWATRISEKILRKLNVAQPHLRQVFFELLRVSASENETDIRKLLNDLMSEPDLSLPDFFCVRSLEASDGEEVVERLQYALSNANALEEYLRYLRVQNDMERITGKDFIDLFLSGLIGKNNHLPLSFEYTIYRSLVRIAYDKFDILRTMSGVSLDETRSKYRDLDRRLLQENAIALAAKLCANRVDPGNWTGKKSTFTGESLIRHEIQKSRNHVPLRDLVQRAGLALLQLKPCFMMSPLSVAQFIPAGAIDFDVLVIDEASQVLPQDALAAISRSKRVVVVGDSNQLPPTTFFDKSSDSDDSDDDTDYDSIDNESILGLASSQLIRSRRLRWHYRSKHESLIAFSNKYFYENDLIVMPSPHSTNSELGVKSHFINSTYSSSLNIGEAEAVVDAILRFMRTDARFSLGVVAMNSQQAEYISTALNQRIENDSAARKFIAKWESTLTPFFVKNLESVQGDERDVVMISTVYGPAEKGGRVAQNFGPITRAGGWRRLNVLFTRARYRIDLFTSMRPSDILVDPQRTGRGITALRDYLEFASTGRIEVGNVTNRAPDSDFEIAVARMLEARGYEVVPQVGVANYFIDMAVRDPRNGGFLLGIECDGATYHGARSARDRDRTREENLNGLGWRLYRIWSTDWFANPRREITKLCEHLQSLLGSDVASAPPTMQKSAVSTEILAKESHDDLSPIDDFSHFDVSANRHEQPASPPDPSYSKRLSSYDSLVSMLKDAGQPFIDQRSRGGALWIIGGEELSNFIMPLQARSIAITFAPNGSKSTENKPAWFTRYEF